MADTTIDQTESARGRASYDLGPANWKSSQQEPFGPWVPNLAKPGGHIALSEKEVIDLIILGDGYTQRLDFEQDLQDWLDAFFGIRVFEEFRGAFRIRAIYRESPEPASPERTSYYRVRMYEHVNDDRSKKYRLSRSNKWWNEQGPENEDFRARLAEDVSSLSPNVARYPASLDVRDGGTDSKPTVIHGPLDNLLKNCVVQLLIRAGDPMGIQPGAVRPIGMARRVELEDGPLYVAFAQNPLHELSHAFAYLEDEYIGKDKRGVEAERTNPSRPSIYTLSNLSFSDRDGEVPWQHLSPWGRLPRQAGSGAPPPVVGWCWLGGEDGDAGVWHAEYECESNYRGNNYFFTKDAESDASLLSPQGPFPSLRVDRYCLWCQEIVAIRIFEKTGQFAEPGDPNDPSELGQIYLERWVDRWRDHYWEFFDLDQQILEREEYYADPANVHLEAHGLELWQSDLYSPFRAPDASPTSDPVSFESWLLPLVAAF